MPEPYSSMVDILLGYDTDIYFKDGDLMTTSGIDYIEREIYKLLISSPGDWKTSPRIGANLEMFIGQKNTREVGKLIEKYIQTNLTQTVYPGQVIVRVIPMTESSLLCVIDIMIENFVVTKIPFEFDFVSGFKKLTLRDAEVIEKKSSPQYMIDDISQSTKVNKYYERQRAVR